MWVFVLKGYFELVGWRLAVGGWRLAVGGWRLAEDYHIILSLAVS